MSLISKSKQTVAENLYVLSRTRKIYPQDLVLPEWKLVQEEYTEHADGCWLDKAQCSFINAILFQKAPYFVLSRHSFRTLCRGDENWTPSIGMKNENWAKFLLEVVKGGFVALEHETKFGVRVYRVVHETLLGFLSVNLESRRQEVITYAEMYKNDEDLPLGDSLGDRGRGHRVQTKTKSLEGEREGEKGLTPTLPPASPGIGAKVEDSLGEKETFIPRAIMSEDRIVSCEQLIKCQELMTWFARGSITLTKFETDFLSSNIDGLVKHHRGLTDKKVGVLEPLYAKHSKKIINAEREKAATLLEDFIRYECQSEDPSVIENAFSASHGLAAFTLRSVNLLELIELLLKEKAKWQGLSNTVPPLGEGPNSISQTSWIPKQTRAPLVGIEMDDEEPWSVSS